MWRLSPRVGSHPGFSIHLYPDFGWCGLSFWVNFSRLICDLWGWWRRDPRPPPPAPGDLPTNERSSPHQVCLQR